LYSVRMGLLRTGQTGPKSCFSLIFFAGRTSALAQKPAGISRVVQCIKYERPAPAFGTRFTRPGPFHPCRKGRENRCKLAQRQAGSRFVVQTFILFYVVEKSLAGKDCLNHRIFLLLFYNFGQLILVPARPICPNLNGL